MREISGPPRIVETVKHVTFSWLWTGLALLATACGGPSLPAEPPRALSLNVLYPLSSTELEMGQSQKAIIEVVDEYGSMVDDATVMLKLLDPAGEEQLESKAQLGDGDVYRTDAWTIPHKAEAGEWTMKVEAESGSREGSMEQTLTVRPSVSEMLLEKYGFWVHAPDLRGVVPILGRERGDARNGAIIWGGTIPAQHIFPENWLEIHWREGDFGLDSEQEVRAFMLGELGDLGFTPLRDLGPYERTRFKQWDAWFLRARGQYTRYDVQWLIFHAPEVDKTYAISTSLVQAPIGIDAHAALRDSFEVHPEVQADGTAPEPLVRRLPAPELISPDLGEQFLGRDAQITLAWEPVRDLGEDEYYEVAVDYNYVEDNNRIKFATRETEFTLPESLYDIPNCGVFNWRITLMRQVGTEADGRPEGEPLSYASLYWYVEWRNPPNEPVPFDRICPNPQT